MGLPEGTVTFVLGDVVGSTALWQSAPDAAAEAIAKLDRIVGELVEARGGARPIEQGEGDSFVAAFGHALHAALFAADLQRAIASAVWPDGVAPSVRVGVHTGDARLSDGMYRGDALNRCSRVRDLAYGGQILVSGTTADLVVDGLSGGLFLKDLGVHGLRDLGRPEHLRQLVHADLRIEFPRLASLDRLPHNLPAQLTSFIGREVEAVDVGELLDEGRLVTLTGAGGCGKTRLALHVACAEVDRLTDGAWFVDLSMVTDRQLVARAIASALGVHELPFEDASGALEQYLHDKRVLLVVDNCEHVIDDCAVVIERLLALCPGVSVLATSREPLGVAGETTYRVPSLPLPKSGGIGCASVELFVARAVAARPSFRLDEDSVEAVEAICERLDGLPLAIELAAARCRALSPRQIADQLEERFSLLSGGARTALPRQRTLEASVAWSVDLLGDDERQLFRRLSVFAGSFSLDAAEQVATYDSPDVWHVVDLLTRLVDKSLVQAEERGGDVRYRLLETIRHFASQQLLAAGESTDARNAHCDYYVAKALSVAPGLVGSAVAEAYAFLDREIDNVRGAQSWLIHSGDASRALELVAALHLLWTRNAGREVLRSIEDALALDGGEPATRARSMLAGAEVAWLSGLLDRNLELLDGADDIARTVADEEPAVFVDLFRGWRGLLLSDPRTDELLSNARDRFRAHEQYYWSADALYGLGSAHVMRGDLIRGDAVLAEAVEEARRSVNPVALSRALVIRSTAVMQRGDFEAADRMLDEATALRTGTADLASALLGDALRAWIAVARGEYDEAIDASVHVGQASRRAGVPVTLAWSCWVHLSALRARGDHEGMLGVVEDLERTVGLAWAGAWCGAIRSELALADGNLALAHATANVAIATTHEHAFAGYARSRCLLTLARVLRASGSDEAEDVAHQALATAGSGDLRLETIEALELLASLAADTGDVEYAARLFGAAMSARDEIGAPAPPLSQPEIWTTDAALRAALDTERLGVLLAEGSTLDVAAARAYAERGRGARRRPATGWSSLTPTELRVVELAATGIKNADIAERMFVSIPTVKTHLVHVFTKLGVSTRAELAALAARRHERDSPPPQPGSGAISTG